MRMTSPKTTLSYSAALVAVLVVAWFLGTLSHLTGVSVWILRIGVAVVLALIVGGVWWLLHRRKKAREAAGQQQGEQAAAGGAAAAPDDVDRLVHEASAKIASSSLGRGFKLSSLPAFFVLGEAGSGKTSDVVFSGLEPELLAGQVYQNDAVIPTAAANIWFARKTLFVEASGKLAAESRPWTRLIQRLAPGKLRVIFGGKNRAPRAAIVCFDCQKIAKAKDLESITGSARALRTRLEEMSQQLGASFPVYVFFNRLDCLPYFEEFAATLTDEEAGEVIGATLPAAAAQQSGVYAEQESRRLTEFFNGICASLADCRPGLLSREHDSTKLPAVYEFPRQFRKLSRPVVQFLVDLCRPSHLRAGPFLRGFYFTGMRMVSPAATPSGTIIATKTMLQPKPSVSTSATTILRPEDMATGTSADWAGATLTPGAGEMRQVPQWLFLGHVFSDVLLKDSDALGASAASTKVSFWRRALLATAAVAGLVLIVGFLVSFFGNHARESRVETAARAIQFSPVPASQLASQTQLQHLDALRQSLVPLIGYRKDGPPLHLRWGLYAGDRVLQAGLQVYFRRFHQLLLASTQASMRQSLAQLPLTPGSGDAYSPVYATLKAYLITTADPDKASCPFLTPELMKDWAGGSKPSSAQSRLAQSQFNFYCEQLKAGNPYSSKYDTAAVVRARGYLAQFGATQRIYQAMISSASKANPEFNYRQQFPQAEALVRDSNVVPGAFTKAGWKFMQDAIAHSDRYFSGEEWVLGKQSAQSIDRAKLQQDLLGLYQADFIKHWRDFLKSAAVVRYASINDASRKLLEFSGNQSPLLLFFCQVSRNTAVGSKDVTDAFQSVQTVVPPACKNQYVQGSNTSYVNGLLQLQSCLSQVATTPSAQQDAARSSCLNNANRAKIAALQIAQKFKIDEQGHTERTVQHLMQEPIESARGLLRPVGPGSARDLCAQYDAMRAAYPFRSSSNRLATLDELNAFFAPSTGAISQLYQSKLTNLLIPEGSRYIPKPSSSFHLDSRFLRFFNHAMEVQQALYPNGAKQPQYSFTLTPFPSQGIKSLTLEIDGASYTSKGNDRKPMQYVWPGTGAQGVTLMAKFSGGSKLTLLHFSGLWAVFHFFGAAAHVHQSGNGWLVQWSPTTSGQPMTLPNGQPVTIQFQVTTNGEPFILEPGFFSGMSCTSRIVR
jgi:type VI secretion system protein ImpL